MKMIVAFVQAYRLDAVTRRLESIPHLPGMTVSNARGFGREKVREPPHTAREALTDFTRTARIEVIAPEELVEAVVEAVVAAARTGQHGDGKIVVLPVDDAIRVRTGERADAAL